MGRPIKKTYFGNKITPYQNHATGGKTGVGGESVTSTVLVGSSGTNYSAGDSIVFSAPQIAGGIRATGTPVFSSVYGGITGITVVNPGTGYLSTATVSVTAAATVNVTGNSTNSNAVLSGLSSVTGIYLGMRADAPYGMQASSYVIGIGSNYVTLSKTMTATTSSMTITFSGQGSGLSVTTALTTTTNNAIAFNSFLTTGTSAVSNGDILKQEASRRYLVNNSQGQGQCILVTTSTLTAGQMNIVATDWNGSTYYVRKLTARKAVVVQTTATGSFLVGNGVATGWTLGAATGTIVTISDTI